MIDRVDQAWAADISYAALEAALTTGRRPEIFNTDQGAQFTSELFTDVLEAHEIRISMDGRGRCLDNVFVERLWRSLKYEEAYLHAYEDAAARSAADRCSCFTLINSCLLMRQTAR